MLYRGVGHFVARSVLPVPFYNDHSKHFSYQVLNRTAEANSLGPIQEPMLLALFIAWILVFLGVFKGIGSIGWAASITATVPYLLVGKW